MKKYIFLSVLIIISLVYYLNYAVGKNKLHTLKTLLKPEQKELIKKYILPYKFISKQDQTISKQKKEISQHRKILNFTYLESKIKINNNDIQTTKSNFALSNGKSLLKYKLINGFNLGINNIFPGSGFIDFYEENLFLLSSRGVLAYSKDISDKNNLKQIKNNIEKYINVTQFSKHRWFSLKDVLIFEGKIFISYTQEIKKDCWNTSIIYGNINFKNIKFEKLFSPEECIHSKDNFDGEFNAHQSGGRITPFNDDHILLSIGDYRSRFLAQDKKSVNGKILKISINNNSYEIISMGHRNPQGLYFDKENNFILETEHGPKGGDEINLIEIEKINKDKILNYGWPIVSAGEHYTGKIDIKKYEKYPLYKSHSKHNFIEPLKSFVPSIGVSEIAKVGANMYVVSSLNDQSLYFFELDKKKQIQNMIKTKVFERIRDLRFNNNKLYLFMEDTASIGVLDLN